MPYTFPTSPAVDDVTTDGAWKWDGARWVPAEEATVLPTQLDSTTITATAGQTVFTVHEYIGDFESVYLNGVKLLYPDDYSRTSSTSITLTQGALADSKLEFTSFDALSVTGASALITSTVTATQGQTVFNVDAYNAGFEVVYVNGTKLVAGTDYARTNSTTITLTEGAQADDVFEMTAFQEIAVGADKASKVAGATAGHVATLDADGDLVDSGELASQLNGGNILYNSGFKIWQRGSSFSIGGGHTYFADRWKAAFTCTTNLTINRTVSGLGGLRADIFAGTGCTSGWIMQYIPAADATDLFNQYITVTFDVYSNRGSSRPMGIVIGHPNAYDNFSSHTYTESNFTTPHSGNGTFETISATFGPLTDAGYANGFLVQLQFNEGKDDAEIIAVRNAQVELGKTFKGFVDRKYADELSSCMAFYETSYSDTIAPGTLTTTGAVTAGRVSSPSNQGLGECSFISSKRAYPTMTLYSPDTGVAGKAYDVDAATDRTGTFLMVGHRGFSIYYPSAGTHWGRYHYVADAEL